MQRSRTILGLLAVGMVALNAAAIRDMRGFPYQTGGELFFAVLFGQLSALCVYVMFADVRFLTRLLLPASAVLLVTLLAILALGRKVSIDAFAVFGCYVALLMIVLWLIQRVPRLWRVLRLSSVPGRRFSLQQLLILIAFVAPLLAAVGKSDFVRSMSLPMVVLFAESTAITLIAIYATTEPVRWTYRLAYMLSTAFVVAAAANLAIGAVALPTGLLEATILFALIELGGLMPRTSTADIGRSDPQQGAPQEKASVTAVP
jgi:hypothetical protein